MDIFKPIMVKFWQNVEKQDNKRLSKQKLIDGIEELIDIPYCEDKIRGHLLDIYFKSEYKNKKLPVIINIHGGGWMYGYKELNKNYNYILASKGFCVISISYRLAGDSNNIRINNQIEDVFSALNYISKNVNRFPADINNVFLVGDSAGGQLACLASAINEDESLQKLVGTKENLIKFNAVGAISPVIDMITPNPAMFVNLKIILGEGYKKSKYYNLLDFKNVANSSLPPFYIATSSGDFVEKQAIKLHNILNKLKVENKLFDCKEKYKGKKLPHVFSVSFPYDEPGEKVINEMTEFFKSKMVAVTNE